MVPQGIFLEESFFPLKEPFMKWKDSMDVNGPSNFNGTIMEEITSVPPLTYAQKGGLHQQKVERNKKNTELWTGTHLTLHELLF